MEWQAVAKSVIGVKHIKAKQPCQDYSSYSFEDSKQVVLGAISDGMGSAKYSHIGSQLAVDSSLTFLKREKVWNLERDELNLRRTFESLLLNIRGLFAQQAQHAGCSIDELACTLIVFVATPEWLAAMQVGDGQVVVSLNEGYQLLFEPDKGEYVNETTPITAENALQAMRFYLGLSRHEFICAATDGIENFSLSKEENWKPFNGFFDGLRASMLSTEKSLEDKEKDFESFLNSSEINRRTDDDKTLLLCVYSTFSYADLSRFKTKVSLTNPDLSEKIRNENAKNRELFHEIKKQLAQIPETEGFCPELKITSKRLEITFQTNSPLKYHQPLFERIQEFFRGDNYIRVQRPIDEVIVYNQDIRTSTLYFREGFRIKKSKSTAETEPILLFLTVLFIALITVIVVSLSYSQLIPIQQPPSPESPSGNTNFLR